MGTTIVEPRGHSPELSKFERVWSEAPHGTYVDRARFDIYDPINLLAYTPVHYSFEPMPPLSIEVTDEDICEEVQSLVREEFPEGQGNVLDRWLSPPTIVGEEIANINLSNMIRLAEIESSLIYGPYVRRIKSSCNGSTSAFIHAILCDERLGNRANVKNVSKELLDLHLKDRRRKLDRLVFVSLGLPFKDQNPLRTNATAGHVDLAEIGFMSQLHLQGLAFYQQHPYGCDHIIFSDGTLYARIFGIERIDAEAYLQRLRYYRNLLNLQGTIHILSLEDCIDRLPEQDFELLTLIKKRTRSILTDSRSTLMNSNLSYSLRSLSLGMRRNLNTRCMLQTLEWQEKARILFGSEKAAQTRSIERELDERSDIAAVEYAAINVALRLVRVVSRTFPTALRATIHAKPGQIAVPRSGNSYPWNGVGTVLANRPFPDRLQARALADLGSKPDRRWVVGRATDISSPLYYREVS